MTPAQTPEQIRQIRLECLKLAIAMTKEGEDVLAVAGSLASFVLDGIEGTVK